MSSSAAAASAAPSGTLRFRRPRPSPSTAAHNAMEEKETMSIFPSAIFTDATYSRGLLVPNDNYAPPVVAATRRRIGRRRSSAA